MERDNQYPERPHPVNEIVANGNSHGDKIKTNETYQAMLWSSYSSFTIDKMFEITLFTKIGTKSALFTKIGTKFS